MKFIDKYINNKLDKEGLMTVPKSWAKDYQDAIKAIDAYSKDNTNLDRGLKTLGEAYNTLLQDYVNIAPVKNMKKDLEGVVNELPKTKEELATLYYNTFKVTYSEEKPKKEKRKKKAK